jgi:hypothetical protein
MSIYRKLQEARIELQRTKLSKSGKNKFAGYEYFELADFLPSIQEICLKVGLCGTVSFTADTAYLTFHDIDAVEPNVATSFTTFTSPMSTAQLKGCHEVQNLGAVQTYLRRYLWTMAFEICEHDSLDAVTGKETGKEITNEKPIKPIIKEVIKDLTKDPKEDVITGKEGPWQITVSTNDLFQDAVKLATSTLLAITNTPADVDEIFKVNRIIYDKLKAEHNEIYAELLTSFKSKKKELV